MVFQLKSCSNCLASSTKRVIQAQPIKRSIKTFPDSSITCTNRWAKATQRYNDLILIFVNETNCSIEKYFLFLQFYDSLVRLYHQMVPNAHENLNVPQPGMPRPNWMNGMVPNQGMMNGGMVNSLQNNQQPSTAPIAQQPGSSTTNMNSSVIEID